MVGVRQRSAHLGHGVDEVLADLLAQLPQLRQFQVLQVHRVLDGVQQRGRRLRVAPQPRIDGIFFVGAPLVQPARPRLGKTRRCLAEQLPPSADV